jgi:hypothetical protein
MSARAKKTMAESAETHAKKKDAVIAEPVVARAFLEHIFEPAEKACHGQEPEPVEAIEQLAVEDCELATAQFLDSCRSTTFKPLLFNATGLPTKQRIDYVVARAVKAFLTAYRR